MNKQLNKWENSAEAGGGVLLLKRELGRERKDNPVPRWCDSCTQSVQGKTGIEPGS